MKKIVGIALVATAIACAYCYKVTAYKSGEYRDAVRNVKVCVYKYSGKNYFYSVETYNMCPYSIEVCQ